MTWTSVSVSLCHSVLSYQIEIHIYMYTHTHNRFSLLADSAICRLAYLLKCIWNLKISTPCGTFTVIHGQACSQLRMNKAAFGLFLSVLIL